MEYFVIILIILMMLLLTIIWDFKTMLMFTLCLGFAATIGWDLLKLSYRSFKRCNLKRKVNKLRRLKKQMKVQKLLNEYKPETDGPQFKTMGSDWSLTPTFLKTLIRPKTRHNELFKIALITMFGMLYTVLCFYQQILLFEKMTTATVILVLAMMFVSVVLPISWKLGLLFALLLIPTAIVITLRAGVIRFLAFDLQTATRTNVEMNIRSLLNSFSCEIKKTKEFGKKTTSVGFVGSAQQIELNFDNPFEYIRKQIEKFVQQMEDIVQWIEEKVKQVDNFLKKLENLFENIFEFLGDEIGAFITNIFNYFLGNFIKKAVNSIKTVFKEFYVKLSLQIQQVKKEVVAEFRAALEVDFQDIYVYKLVRSKPNTSFTGIYGQVFRKFVLRHPYLLYVDVAAQIFATIFAFWIFFIIFIPPFLYIKKFRNSPSFDNNFIDKHLEEYDKEMMESGQTNSLFPLDFFERQIFTRRDTWRINLAEIRRTLVTAMADAVMILYVLLFFVFDKLMYFAVVGFNFLGNKIMEWLLPKGEDFLRTIDEFKIVTLRRLIKSYERFRVSIMDCLPTPSPTEEWIYMKCLINLIFLILIAMIRPYINRSKSWLCSRYFPHMNRPRAINLYQRILLYRLLVKGRVFAMPKNVKVIRSKLIDIKKKIYKEIDKKEIEQKEIHQEEKKRKGGLPGFCAICTKKIKTQEHHFACATPDCPANFCEVCLYTPSTDNLKCPYCGKDIFDIGEENFSVEKDSSFEELDDWMGDLE